MNQSLLLFHIDDLHTTKMGIERLKKNLNIDGDVVAYCKQKIADEHCHIERVGKNYYCEIGDIRITVHAKSYTIITAHLIMNVQGRKKW